METYIGKVCERHPALGGLREKHRWLCVDCLKMRRAERAAKAKQLRALIGHKRRGRPRSSPEEIAQRAAALKAKRRSDLLSQEQKRQLKTLMFGSVRAAENHRRQRVKVKRRLLARQEGDYAHLGVRSLRRHPSPRATYEELNTLWGAQNGRCGLTGLPFLPGVQPHLDHKVPASKDGASTIDNLQWVHPMANHAKGSHSVEEFRAWVLAAADSLRGQAQ